MRTMTTMSSTALLALLLLALPAAAQDFGNAQEYAAGTLQNKEYSPYAGRGYPTQVFWGDTPVSYTHLRAHET